jgi:hypothetical protein
MIFVTPSPGISGRYRVPTLTLDVNAVADNAIVIPYSKWRLNAFYFHTPSTSLAVSLAVVGLFTATAGGGSNLITSVVTGLTSASNIVSQTLGLTTTVRTEGTIYLRPTTAHGSAATLGATIFIDDLS